MQGKLRKLSVVIIVAILCTFAPFSVHAKDKTIKKAVYIIVDGVPADVIERVSTPAIDSIIKAGGYHRSQTGGEVGGITQTPTISAVCYNSILTATWVNKHNVWGNDIKDPNYNYPTLFKVIKDNVKNSTIAVFSGWEENRTRLVGDGEVGSGMLNVDYYFHDSDKNTERYKSDDPLRILKLDQDVAEDAARCIVNDGPTATWVYLWFMDDAGHRFGTDERFDKILQTVDKQVSLIWNAVKTREADTGEEWLTIVVTDHGRTENDGHGHGGQTARQRTTWIAMDRPGNDYFNKTEFVSNTDIMPTICNFLKVRVPSKIAREWEGVPMVGNIDFANLKAKREGNTITFTWEPYSSNDFTLRVCTTNYIKDGEVDGKDRWITIGRRSLEEGKFEWDCSGLPSDFYKFSLESQNTIEAVWVVSDTKQ